MRLTLRTLLAWLDDTLPPEEVREIGTQVSETPFAQQLIDRIRKVSRRRRLTVPPHSGPEAVDPNMVAAYLDNELEADRVAEYEKLCLASDVHLAEAASCHQILSLIKNKAKVPPEARYRMYRLFKGPEAVRTSYRGAAAGGKALAGAGVVPSLVPGDSEPPWADERPDRASPVERFGPAALAVALAAVLGVVGWLNLREADDRVRQGGDLLALGIDADDRPDPLDERRPRPGPAAGRPGAVPPFAAGDAAGFPTTPAEPDEATPPAADLEPAPADPDPEPAPELPEGVAGVVERTDGIALRARREGTAWRWERLGAADELAHGDRVVNLAPFRTTIGLGPIRAAMIAQSELRVGRPGEGQSARIDLSEGGVVLRSSEAGRAVAIGFEGRTITVEPPTGQPVGLSWYGLRAPGEESGRPVLAILTPEGTLGVRADGDDEFRRFEGPIMASFDAEVGLLGAEAAVMPRWVVDPEPPPAEARAGEAFAGLFEGSTGPITFVLLEGIEDEDADVRNLSVAALGATGNVDRANLELVMPLLNRQGDPALRSTAINILSRRMDRGPEEAAGIRTLLGRFAAPVDAAADLDRLLTGYGEAQLGNEALARLVDDLVSPNPSVRQLALQTLQMITGREAHDYDPDAPDGPGLKYWQDLLKAGRLVPVGPPDPGDPTASPNPGDRRR